MKIIITKEVTLGDVRDVFAAEFPLLSLRFFETAVNYVSGKPMEGRRIIDMNKTFGEFNPEIKNISIELATETRVKDLEKSFHEKTDVYAQVYRKSGNIWLQTTATDFMTLEEVEKLSEMMEEKVEEVEKQDYHEQL